MNQWQHAFNWCPSVLVILVLYGPNLEFAKVLQGNIKLNIGGSKLRKQQGLHRKKNMPMIVLS